MRSAQTALTALTQAAWKKSSHSRENGCIEIATTPDVTGIRDSKLDSSPVLAVDKTTFAAFLDAAKHDRFSHR